MTVFVVHRIAAGLSWGEKSGQAMALPALPLPTPLCTLSSEAMSLF